jgi:hypothetical protein
MTTDPIIPIVPEPIPRTPEQIAQDIKASHDSVDLINQIVADDQHNDEIHYTVDRNVRHLRNCLTLPHIMENATTADKIAFADAATLGEDWVQTAVG